MTIGKSFHYFYLLYRRAGECIHSCFSLVAELFLSSGIAHRPGPVTDYVVRIPHVRVHWFSTLSHRLERERKGEISLDILQRQRKHLETLLLKKKLSCDYFPPDFYRYGSESWQPST